MTRLLFAAARGARLDWYDTFTHMWHPNVVNVPVTAKFKSIDMYYRIHPDDAHLQYGPISTALRELAETGKEPYTLIGLMARKAFEYEWEYPAANEDEGAHAQMLALILAESLADEGL